MAGRRGHGARRGDGADILRFLSRESAAAPPSGPSRSLVTLTYRLAGTMNVVCAMLRRPLSLGKLSYVGQLVALTVVYLALARLGLMMEPVSGFATLIWPPTGISLATLMLGGYGLWPGIALG